MVPAFPLAASVRLPFGGRRKPGPRALSILALILVGWGTGCAGDEGLSGDPIPVEAPQVRVGDDLRAFPELVEILGLQTRRDGTGLEPFLFHERREVRARAALALASVQDPERWDALHALLADPDAEVRRDAAFALGQIPQPDGAAALMQALREEGDREARLALMEALGKQGDTRAASGLLEVEPLPEERFTYLIALSRLAMSTQEYPPTGLVATLARSLYSGDDRVREASAYYFGRAPDPAIWVVTVDVVREAMDLMGLEAPALMHLAVALGRLRDPEDGPRLLRLLQEARDWRIRTNAARALASPEFLEIPGTRAALWHSVEGDPSEHVAVAAAEALASGFQIPEPVLDRAGAWVQGDPSRWRTHAPFLRPLATAGRGEVVVAWTRSQGREGEGRAAVRGLEVAAGMGGDEVSDLLFELANHPDPAVRSGAVASLAERWPRELGGAGGLTRYAELFAREIGEDPPLAASAAARALGHPTFHPYGSVGILHEAWTWRGAPHLESEAPVPMREVPVLEALLRAMGETGDPQFLPLLDEALAAPDHRLRRAAARAREELTGQEVRGLNLPDPERLPDVAALEALGPDPELLLETNRGRVVVRLVPDQAPLTVTAMAELANAGAYDGTHFHRVVPNFVVQGGDVSLGDGTGGPGFALPSEFTQIPFLRGVIGMASSGKDTEGSQFYLTHSMQPHLDGGYTSFGWVVSGEDVLDRLLEGDQILEARVRPHSVPAPEPAPRPEPDPTPNTAPTPEPDPSGDDGSGRPD